MLSLRERAIIFVRPGATCAARVSTAPVLLRRDVADDRVALRLAAIARRIERVVVEAALRVIAAPRCTFSVAAIEVVRTGPVRFLMDIEALERACSVRRNVLGALSVAVTGDVMAEKVRAARRVIRAVVAAVMRGRVSVTPLFIFSAPVTVALRVKEACFLRETAAVAVRCTALSQVLRRVSAELRVALRVRCVCFLIVAATVAVSPGSERATPFRAVAVEVTLIRGVDLRVALASVAAPLTVFVRSHKKVRLIVAVVFITGRGSVRDRAFRTLTFADTVSFLVAFITRLSVRAPVRVAFLVNWPCFFMEAVAVDVRRGRARAVLFLADAAAVTVMRGSSLEASFLRLATTEEVACLVTEAALRTVVVDATVEANDLSNCTGPEAVSSVVGCCWWGGGGILYMPLTACLTYLGKHYPYLVGGSRWR